MDNQWQPWTDGWKMKLKKHNIICLSCSFFVFSQNMHFSLMATLGAVACMQS